MFTARDPPPAVVYLDCEQTHDNIFSLKWSLPQTDGVLITHSVLEVKDDSGEWKPENGPIQGTSFMFQGKDSSYGCPHSYPRLTCQWLSNQTNSQSLHWLMRDK